MTPTEFIEKTLRRSAIGNSAEGLEVLNSVINEVKSRFECHEFNDLDKLIAESIKQIKDETGLLQALQGGDCTVQKYKNIAGICEKTARKRLNARDDIKRVRVGRSYIYTIT